MKAIYIKQLLIVLICSIGLHSTGNYLAKMSYIETLLDGFYVMIFFICFFPFVIISLGLINKAFKSLYKFAHH